MNKNAAETQVSNTVTTKGGGVKIVIATLLALVVAALALLTIILPAEFNRDPLGVGNTLGIMGLSESAAPQTVNMGKTAYRQDKVAFELLPFEAVEYKYELDQGSALIYSWAASDSVSFEFHGEPEGGPEGFAETFHIGKSDHEKGAFTAPFSGIHGWYWVNRGSDAVTVELLATGFYTATLEFRDGFVKKQILEDQTQ